MSLLLFLSFFCSSPTPARNEEEEMLLLDLLSFRFAPVLVLRPELSAAFEEQFGKHLVGGFDLVVVVVAQCMIVGVVYKKRVPNCEN